MGTIEIEKVFYENRNIIIHFMTVEKISASS